MNDFLFDPGTERETKVCRDGQINFSAEQLFEIQLQAHVVVEGGPADKHDNQIDITAGPG